MRSILLRAERFAAVRRNLIGPKFGNYPVGSAVKNSNHGSVVLLLDVCVGKLKLTPVLQMYSYLHKQNCCARSLRYCRGLCEYTVKRSRGADAGCSLDFISNPNAARSEAHRQARFLSL